MNILQITAVKVGDEYSDVYGLGDDNKLYQWDKSEKNG